MSDDLNLSDANSDVAACVNLSGIVRTHPETNTSRKSGRRGCQKDENRSKLLANGGVKEQAERRAQLSRRLAEHWLEFLKGLRGAYCEQHPVGLTNPGGDSNAVILPLTRKRAICFAYVARAAAQLHRLQITNTFATRRDLFYEYKMLYGVQRNLDLSVSFLCQLMNTPRIEHNVLSSGRGLVAGRVVIKENGRRINCLSSVVAINDFSRCDIQTNAQLVLVVEKDTVFQKLLSERFLKSFSPVILVTGKGYPDVATRILLKKLVAIPMFILVDCDPHGVEIAMTYKYGGAQNKAEFGDLTLPNLQWIGLSRHDVQNLEIANSDFLPLNPTEHRKAKKLYERAAAVGDLALAEELESFLVNGTKLELEAVSSVSRGFMTEKFLPTKLSAFQSRVRKKARLHA